MADSQAEYFQLLAERARLKKQTKSKAELDLEKKERGFSTHFSGANASPPGENEKKAKVAAKNVSPIIKESLFNLPSKGTPNPNAVVEDSNTGGGGSATDNRRRSKWGEPANPLLRAASNSKESDQQNVFDMNRNNSASSVYSTGDSGKEKNTKLFMYPDDQQNISSNNKNNGKFATITDGNTMNENKSNNDILRKSVDSEVEYLEDFEELSDNEIQEKEEAKEAIVDPAVFSPPPAKSGYESNRTINTLIANAIKSPNIPSPGISLLKSSNNSNSSKLKLESQQSVISNTSLLKVIQSKTEEANASIYSTAIATTNEELNSSLVNQILTMGDAQKHRLLQLLHSNVNVSKADKSNDKSSNIADRSYKLSQTDVQNSNSLSPRSSKEKTENNFLCEGYKQFEDDNQKRQPSPKGVPVADINGGQSTKNTQLALDKSKFMTHGESGDRSPSSSLSKKCLSPESSVMISPKSAVVFRAGSSETSQASTKISQQCSDKSSEKTSLIENLRSSLESHNKFQDSKLEDSLAGATSLIKLTSEISSDKFTQVTIRFKILSLWQKSKFAALTCLVLCSKDSKSNENKFIYLSSTTKVLCGLDVLSGTNEAVRMIPSLLADISHRKMFPEEKQMWRGPFSPDKPLEIHLQCSLEAGLLPTLEIIVVNGWGVSAVKDIDIYLDSQCIWSGELPNTSLLRNRRELPNFINEALFRPDWGVNVPLNSRHRKGQSSMTRANSSSNLDLSHKSSSPAVPALGSIVEMQKDNNQPPRGSTPIWLDDAATPRPSSRSQGLDMKGSSSPPDKSCRNSDSGNFSSPPKSDKRSSRRRNPTSENSKYENTEINKNLMGPRDRKQVDKELRTSLDALNLSEKQNLGRLGKSIEKSSSEKKMNGEAIEFSELASVVREIEFKEVAVPDSLKTSEGLSENANLLQSGVEVGISEARRRAGLRSNRISEVTRTVSDALDGISSIISSLKDRDNIKVVTIDVDKKVALDTKFENFAPPFGNSSSILESSWDNFPTNNFSRIRGSDRGVSHRSSTTSNITTGMPEGFLLHVEIYSTWGDFHYVGLNGIDIFDDQGKIIRLPKFKYNAFECESSTSAQSISANPSDINILPEYENDPRTVSNLLNGINFTRDDMHMWLAPVGYFSREKGQGLSVDVSEMEPIATVSIKMSKPTKISMIRIFNYNKSRTHVQRGVKKCRLKLDGKVIFEGTVRMANGDLASADECSEVILFSTDVEVLQSIAKYDEMSCYYTKDMTTDWIRMKKQEESPRPGTAEKSEGGGNLSSTARSPGERPSTSVAGQKAFSSSSSFSSYSSSTKSGPVSLSKFVTQKSPRSPESRVESKKDQIRGSQIRTPSKESNELSKKQIYSDALPNSQLQYESSETVSIQCKKLEILIISTWGDSDYAGLSGLELYDSNSLIISPSRIKIDAEPRDLRDIGACDDPRILDNLLYGVNNSTNDTFMWLAPFTPGTPNRIEIFFTGLQSLSAIHFWNYNKPGESLLRGAKLISLKADGQPIGRWILNIGPGLDGVNFCQRVPLSDIVNGSYAKLPGISISAEKRLGYFPYISPAVRQDYETPILPSGCVWKITILENWHDDYYVGLDLIQFIDANGDNINMSAWRASVQAVPSSIDDTSPGTRDNRTPENLIRHVDTKGLQKWDNCNSWLAPLSRSMTEKEKLRLSIQSLLGSNNALPTSNNARYKEYIETLQNDNIGEMEFPNDNTIFVTFPYPVKVAGMRFFNYSKTPTRGVHDFSVHIDDNLVYMGSLNSAESEFKNDLKGRVPQTVMFTNDPKVIKTEKGVVSYCGSIEQDVLYINERQVMVRSKDMYNRKPSVACEGVHADLDNRPKTSSARK